MTLYHFGNCIALIYAPYHMAYKFTGMSEMGAWWRCVQCGLMFLLTALCKMLFLATFFPDTEAGNLTHEFLRATVDFADYIGIYLALNSVPGKGHTKIFTVALGWSAAEALCSRGVALWVGARGAEFSWKWLQIAAAGNVALLQTMATCALVWLSRPPGPPGWAPALALACGGYAGWAAAALGLGAVHSTGLRAAVAASSALLATNLYAQKDLYFGY